MTLKLNKIIICASFAFGFLFLFSARARADVFYTQSEFNALYNDKVALEIELSRTKSMWAEDKKNYDLKIKQLNNSIDALNDQIAQMQKKSEDDRKQFDAQIHDLQAANDIMQKKGSDQEKALMEENKRLQKKYEDDMKKASADLQAEKTRRTRDIEDLKNSYESKISVLEKNIADLNQQIDDIKKINKSQKDELARMESQSKELENQLSEEIKRGEIRLKKFRGKLIINIDDKISFDSGSAKLKKNIMPALDKIVTILSNYPENSIAIEGNTDNIPIHTAEFRDNWQLSGERALSVLGFLLQNKKLDPRRFTAAGCGEFNPVVSNDTPENRSLNRRVDIVVLPRVDTK
jgi:chemotaxis protein MotB